MSMWRIGRESVRVADPVMTPLDRSVSFARAASDSGSGPLGDIADTVAKWIPGEVLALYTAGVTMIGHPNWFWLAIGVILAPVVVVLGAFANSGKLPSDPRIQARAGLALVAMLLWSLVVPASGWWEWGLVGNNPAAVALAGAALGLVFGLVAEGVSRWVDSQPAKVRTGPAEPPTEPPTWAPAFQPAEPAAELPADDVPASEQDAAVPPEDHVAEDHVAEDHVAEDHVADDDVTVTEVAPADAEPADKPGPRVRMQETPSRPDPRRPQR
jgi:hypothetical protein